MTKKGPLSKTEKYWIENHCTKQTAKEMARELDRAISVVEKYSLSYQKTIGKAGGQFGKKSGAVVMTENASMLGDEGRTKPPGPSTRKPCITKIKPD